MMHDRSDDASKSSLYPGKEPSHVTMIEPFEARFEYHWQPFACHRLLGLALPRAACGMWMPQKTSLFRVFFVSSGNPNLNLPFGDEIIVSVVEPFGKFRQFLTPNDLASKTASHLLGNLE